MSWRWRLFLIVVLTGGTVDLRQLTSKWNIMQQTQVSYIKIGFSKVKVKVNAKLKVYGQVIRWSTFSKLDTWKHYCLITGLQQLEHSNTLHSKTTQTKTNVDEMPTIFILPMMLKDFCCESPILYVYLLQPFRLSFLFFVHRQITLWFWIINPNHVYFLLLQLVPLANILKDLVDSFQLQIFQVTTLNTANVPGISQFPAGTSLNLASSTFDWSHISIFPAIMLQRPVLQSQMLLQMMGISRSCCAVSLFSIQCTR